MTTAKRRGITALIAGAAVGLATIGGAAANSYMTGAVDGDDTLVSGCVIRFSDPDGYPSIHSNAAHISAGCKSVGINPNGRLVVNQTITDPAANPIVFAFAQADETLAGRGITIGASGGTADTEYVLFDAHLGRQLDLTKRSDRMRVQGKFSNAWLGWVHVR